ncbi:N-acetyltransferase [Micromonospora craterilacus]|uniref:N-acetyltransferase n=1 Tax=Micromonospora craterilacus TaxID=1655439 RepID=A0A2W2E359_9ACTN|nr:N-acetyltransferase [Micromonospora craterilacus]
MRVRRAVPAETDVLVPAYADAFADEAVLSWVIPDPADRAARTVPMFRELLTVAVRDDQVIVAELPDGAIVGMSVWLSLADAAARHRQAAQLAEFPVEADAVGQRLAAVSDTVDAHRPPDPHVYLASIGVRPDLRGRGVGGAILAEGLRAADAEGLPTYLEASTEQSRRLYLRHGFHDHGRPLALPDGGPVLRPMWRPAPDGRR